MHVLRVPILAERRTCLPLHKLVLQRLREHPPRAPAPHFLSAGILHSKIVSLPIRKSKLDHPRSVVTNVERQLNTVI